MHVMVVAAAEQARLPLHLYGLVVEGGQESLEKATCRTSSLPSPLSSPRSSVSSPVHPLPSPPAGPAQLQDESEVGPHPQDGHERLLQQKWGCLRLGAVYAWLVAVVEHRIGYHRAWPSVRRWSLCGFVPRLPEKIRVAWASASRELEPDVLMLTMLLCVVDALGGYRSD